MVRPAASTVCGSSAGVSAAASAATANSARKRSTKSSISASATSAPATTASRAPTGTVSPSFTTRRRRTPAAGLSKTFVILVVSISTISSPAATSAPSSTCQAATMPSSMASPHLGMVIA